MKNSVAERLHPRTTFFLAAMASGLLLSASSRSAAEELRDYEASTAVLPGKACLGPDYSGVECWGEFYDTFYYPGDAYGDTTFPYDTDQIYGCYSNPPTLSSGTLGLDTTGATGLCSNGTEWWFEYPAYSDGSNSATCGNQRTVNFEQGSYLEVKIQIHSSGQAVCNGGLFRTGWSAELGDANLSATLYLSGTGWALSNDPDAPAANTDGPYAFDTVSAPHVYRVETFPNGQRVYIDGALQQDLPYTGGAGSNGSGIAGFGDSQGSCSVYSNTSLYYLRYGLLCGVGYTISDDGTTCVDVDECATNNGGCDPGATCVNLPGTRECLAADSAHENVVCGADCALCPSPAAVGTDISGSCVSPQYAYAPAQDSFGMVSFEDLWPHDGDLDFNDLVSAYNYAFVLDTGGNIIGLQATFDVLALGSSITNGFYLHLPVSAALVGQAQLATGTNTPANIAPLATLGSTALSDAVFELAGEPRTLFNNQSGYINTETGLPALTGETLTLSVLFTAPLAPSDFDIGAAPFDVFLARVGDVGHQTHLSQFDGSATGANASLFHTGDDASNQDRTATGGADNTGRYFCNANGLPFALAYPQLADWPIEKDSIEDLYTGITSFASSGGTSSPDFFLSHDPYYDWQSNNGSEWSVITPAPPAPLSSIFPFCDN